MLDALDVPESFPEGKPQRAIHCSRTLNLRSIKAIGGKSERHCVSVCACLFVCVCEREKERERERVGDQGDRWGVTESERECDWRVRGLSRSLKHPPRSPAVPPSLPGYDMDYTLIHYDVDAWEGKAYKYGLETLKQQVRGGGWAVGHSCQRAESCRQCSSVSSLSQGVPVEGLSFDSQLVMRGLIVDKDRGNLIKVDRFG